jgi:hypothetical protein
MVYGGQSINVPSQGSTTQLPPVDNLTIDNMDDLVDVDQLESVDQVTKTMVEFLLTRFVWLFLF